MYRLITPVVDFANSKIGMTVYFEFNQTSSHKTSQSVDIALLEGREPRVMIEAKRVDRRIAAEQIAKYLLPNVRGVVTNGGHWIMCLNGESKAVSLLSTETGEADIRSLDEIVAFIRAEKLTRAGWAMNAAYVDPLIRPQRPAKPDRARRKSNPVEVARDTPTLRMLFDQLPSTSPLESVLFDSMLRQIEAQRSLPIHLRTEIRSSRVSFFDSRSTSRSMRVARIELGRKHPDILVLTALVSSSKTLSQIAFPTPHDKGPHMRRFRLADDQKAETFGVELAKVLSD